MEAVKDRVWAVGESKGDTRKNFIASKIGCGLALRGYEVVLVAADSEGGNMHAQFGIPAPEVSLEDYLSNRVLQLSDVLYPTSKNKLRLICAGSNFHDMANPLDSHMKKLMQGFCSLEADYILIDVGANKNIHPIDFFHFADVGVVATDPSRAALQEAYLFLKTAVQTKLLHLFAMGSPLRKEVESALNGGGRSSNISEVLALIRMIDEGKGDKAVKALQESSFKLIVNVASDGEGEKVSKAFTAAARQFLKVGLPYLGRIYDDMRDDDFSGQNQPPLLSKGIHVDDSINRIADRIVAMRPSPFSVSSPRESSEAEASPSGDIPPPPNMQLGLNEEAVVFGVKLHVQTEDLGTKKFKILTIVFRGGEVLYSKTSEYGDLKRDDTFWEAVMERVEAQHGTVITDIKSGMLDSKISEQWEVRR